MAAALDAFYALDLNRFYKIYSNVHQMIQDRGFEPVDPKLSKDDWISNFMGYLGELSDADSGKNAFEIIDTLSLLFKKGDNKYLLVYFYPLDSKLCQNDMDYIQSLMKKKNARHLIIVANNKATPKVTNVLGILGHRAQFFSENELLFPVINHQLVPKHTLLVGEERDKILNTFGRLADGKIHFEIFPGIFTNDPIVKYYNFKVDDLIQIDRPRKDGFFDIYYRIVIHPITEKDKKTGY